MAPHTPCTGQGPVSYGREWHQVLLGRVDRDALPRFAPRIVDTAMHLIMNQGAASFPSSWEDSEGLLAPAPAEWIVSATPSVSARDDVSHRHSVNVLSVLIKLIP